MHIRQLTTNALVVAGDPGVGHEAGANDHRERAGPSDDLGANRASHRRLDHQNHSLLW